MLFYERLESLILGGSNKVAQKAACYTLSQFVKHLIEKEYTTLIDFFCPKIVGLFVKTRSFHFELTRALIYLIDNNGNKFFVGCLTEILTKLNEIILDDRLTVYQDKVEACSFLTVLGCNLESVADLVNKYYCNDVLTTLGEAVKNRVAKVQQAARAAKEVWEELSYKGQEQTESKKETEHLELGDALTPDDLVKVKSGNGNVADAKSLGYMKRRKKSKNKKAKNQLLQDKRSKSKKLNSSQNKKNSKVMREKIFNMEQERSNLMKQANILKKRDASIDNLMDKYIPKSNKKSKGNNRPGLMSQIKQRMLNVEKGKSIEIIESKRGRDQRLLREQRVRDQDQENEGGEIEEGNGKEESKILPSSEKKNDLQENENEDLFNEEVEDVGDQALNPSTVPRSLAKDLDREAKRGENDFGKYWNLNI